MLILLEYVLTIDIFGRVCYNEVKLAGGSKIPAANLYLGGASNGKEVR